MARVLVVDDNACIRELLQYSLTLAGHTVRTVPDGPSGIASAREDPPEVAILDVKMPGMDGIEVLRALRRLQPNLLVFFFTVYGDFCNKPALAEADGCFVKSAELTPLVEAIARAVNLEPTVPQAHLPPL
jgi:CheY-like chemotaxis protein